MGQTYPALFFLIPGLIGIYLKVPKHRILSPVSFRDIIKTLGLTLAMMGGVTLASLLLNLLFSYPTSQYYPDIPKPFIPWEHPGIIFETVLIPALCEETFFRGYLQNQLPGKRLPILFSAALFAIVHLNPYLIVQYFILGCFFGWLQTYRNNLALPILAHATNNLVVLVALGLIG